MWADDELPFTQLHVTVLEIPPILNDEPVDNHQGCPSIMECYWHR